MSGQQAACASPVPGPTTHSVTPKPKCIPIKHRWLKSYIPSDQAGSTGMTETFVHKSQSLSLRKEPHNHCSNQGPQRKLTESLGISVGREKLQEHLKGQPQAQFLSVTNNLRKRRRESAGPLTEDSKRLCRQLQASPSRLGSAWSKEVPQGLSDPIAAQASLSKLLNVSKEAIYREWDQGSSNTRIGCLTSHTKQGQTRHPSSPQKRPVGQCLERGSLFSNKITVSEFLQHGDLTNLSIGVRTQLDKMRDDKLLALYLNEIQEKQQLEHQSSSLKSRYEHGVTMTTMRDNQEPFWSGWENLGFDPPLSRAELVSSCLANFPDTQTAVKLNGSHSSISPCSVERVTNGSISTVSMKDIFNADSNQNALLQEQTIDSGAFDQGNHQSNAGNDRNTATTLKSSVIRQPKTEIPDELPPCSRVMSSYPYDEEDSNSTLDLEKPQHKHGSHNANLCVLKQEADSAASIEEDVKPDIKKLTVKRPADNKCPICTDEVSGYHYGTYSCESCKGFFKRTIQSKRNERLVCAFMGNCQITLQNRKHCAFCRYKRCLDTGMKREAVREDRQRGGRSMYEGSTEYRRRQLLQIQQQEREAMGHVRKRKPRVSKAPRTATQPPQEEETRSRQRPEIQTQTSRDVHLPAAVDELDINDSCTTSSTSSRTPTPTTRHVSSVISVSGSPPVPGQPYLQVLERLEATFFNPFGLPRVSLNLGHSEKGVLQGAYYLLDHFCKKMSSWVSMMPLIQDLEVSDCNKLLQASWLQVLALTVCVRCHDDEGRAILPDRSHCDLVGLVESVGILDIVRRMRQLANKFRELGTTQEEYLYLKLLLLLNPDVKELMQPSRVRDYQEQVQEHLFDLGLAREGFSASIKIGELLLKLSELERLSHLVREHLVFQHMSGQLGSASYSGLQSMLG